MRARASCGSFVLMKFAFVIGRAPSPSLAALLDQLAAELIDRGGPLARRSPLWCSIGSCLSQRRGS